MNAAGQKMREQIAQLEQHMVDPQESILRNGFHLMPPTGWMNDPNGLCQLDEQYHVFFQYAPYDAKGNGTKGWGHYRTKNWCEFEYMSVPLLPDEEFDRDGVYSGSSFIDDKGMHLFYTGNVKLPGNHDYTTSGRLADTILVESQDGIHFGYLDMTQENILDQAKKLVGMAYGWGDSNGDMDCSSTMNAIYRCFGIVLPRNTSSMAQTGTQIVSLEGMTQEEKLEKIQAMNPGTLLVMKNHVVMYIGQENGEDLILHNFTTCMADDGVSTKEVYQCQITQLNLVTAAGTQYLDAYATAICFPED